MEDELSTIALVGLDQALISIMTNVLPLCHALDIINNSRSDDMSGKAHLPTDDLYRQQEKSRIL